MSRRVFGWVPESDTERLQKKMHAELKVLGDELYERYKGCYDAVVADFREATMKNVTPREPKDQAALCIACSPSITRTEYIAREEAIELYPHLRERIEKIR